MSTESDPLRDTLARVSDLYGSSLREHGVSSKSVGWRDEASQLLRFDRLAQAIRPSDAPITVNDWGCGYAAMYRYLDELPQVTLGAYHGYDINPQMLDEARRFVAGDSRVELIEGTELTRTADYGFVSGTFNVRFAASDDEWREYIEQTLRALARTSRRGFAFNLLSTYVDWKEPHLFYGDPLHFFDFCKRNISRYVTLLHDYPLYEWTICVHMEQG